MECLLSKKDKEDNNHLKIIYNIDRVCINLLRNKFISK